MSFSVKNQKELFQLKSEYLLFNSKMQPNMKNTDCRFNLGYWVVLITEGSDWNVEDQ